MYVNAVKVKMRFALYSLVFKVNSVSLQLETEAAVQMNVVFVFNSLLQDEHMIPLEELCSRLEADLNKVTCTYVMVKWEGRGSDVYHRN